jgi:hypothetical protein
VNSNTNSYRCRVTRWMIVTTAVALLGAGCSRGPAGSGPIPQDPALVVDQFLAAVKANDIATMGTLWGTKRGPASRTMARDDREKRLTVIQSYLAHESYAIVRTDPGAASDERVVRVQLTRLGCTPVVPFTVVRYRAGWLVSDIDLGAAGNPRRSCS